MSPLNLNFWLCLLSTIKHEPSTRREHFGDLGSWDNCKAAALKTARSIAHPQRGLSNREGPNNGYDLASSQHQLPLTLYFPSVLLVLLCTSYTQQKMERQANPMTCLLLELSKPWQKSAKQSQGEESLTGAFLSIGLMTNFLSLKEIFLISLQGKPILGVSL